MNEAAVVVAEWLRSGIPTGHQGKVRPLADKFSLDSILSGIRKGPLDQDDAARIVAALKARGLVETAIVKAGPVSTLLVDFLLKFWDYGQSPYVKEKLAHGQSIGRPTVTNPPTGLTPIGSRTLKADGWRTSPNKT